MPWKTTQLQQVQVGKETTFGTAVAQSYPFSGVQTFDITPTGSGENIRVLGAFGSRGHVVNSVMGEGALTQYLDYDDVGVLFDSVFATATPSGAGPYVRAYVAPDTSVGTRTFLTFGKGDSSDAYSMIGAIASGFTLTVGTDSVVTIASNWVSSHVATDSLDSVSENELIYVSPADVTVSMGNIGGSLTAINCDVKSAELVYNNNTTVGHGLGAVEGCDYQVGNEHECTLSLVVEASNAVAQAVFESLLGTSPTVPEREIKLNITDSTNIIEIDFSGYIPVDSQSTVYNDADGHATFTLNFAHKFDPDSNLTSFLDISLTNGTAAYFA